ncbi:NUDIX domain-containing protein [Rhodoplanes sp. Z2-YC6860]|uniref:NUDIX domain-containing protein n=1 Tax=Rhodoplanes sp. Z2-YC6860 TaxID=674703 RepID=UPI00078CF6EA|nr:NUDIX hydrolase [Rhodoplanes sp. Z2-YC6860]AMN43130.1 mutator protein [Rhodoplanes sp. Z2-YC6860]
MVKSAKLVAVQRRGRQVLLVRRRKDKRWMFPGGKRKPLLKESARACLRRELREELPKLKVGRFRRWKSLSGRNRYSSRPMSDAVFLAKAVGSLRIGAPKEIDRAAWRNPWKTRLTPTSKHIRDKLVSTGHLKKR